MVDLQLKDEDNDTDEGNQVYEGVRFPYINETREVGTRERDLCPVSPFRPRGGSKYAGSKRIKVDLGHFHSWAGDQRRMANVGGVCLPVADGTLTSHTPVAVDEVTRIPKTTRTYLFAPVKAYTLRWSQLNASGHMRMARAPYLRVRNI